jgi:Asp-tRNA(Asn)/Glu-tRNA(Gln) amidotransferase A subunit family amidase
MIRTRKLSAVEALDDHLAAIARHNPALNAVITTKPRPEATTQAPCTACPWPSRTVTASKACAPPPASRPSPTEGLTPLAPPARHAEQFLGQYDVLLATAGSVSAFTHREIGAPHTVDDQTVAYTAAFASSYQFSLTGHPVLTLPVGRDGQGLPIGVQLVARRWSEDRLLAIGHHLAEMAGPFVPPPGY